MKKTLMILMILITKINAETNILSIPKGYSISYEINNDITNDGIADKVYFLKSKDKRKNPYLLLIMDNSILLKSSLVIPMVQLSPDVAFFQPGFDIDSSSMKKIYYDSDNSNSSFHIQNKQEEALVLISRKDGVPYEFKFYFTYIKESRNFKLKNVYLISFNESCDHSLNAVYEVKSKVFKNMTLKHFNGVKMHQVLYKKPVWINQEMKLYKIQSIELKELYNEIFKLYKSDKIKFKEYMSYMIDDSCKLKYYLEQKYFFEQNITFSNNLAFFFEKAGYYKESIYLLEKILKKYPNRTVAHYNIADAYWALGEKKKAIEFYKTYIKQMKEKGKSKRIPKVVWNRTSTKL